MLPNQSRLVNLGASSTMLDIFNTTLKSYWPFHNSLVDAMFQFQNQSTH